MTQLVTGEAFSDLFRTFTRSARRMETRDRYAVEKEAAPLAQFLDGGPVKMAWFRGWLDNVRSMTRDGRPFSRVRLYSDPLSEYLRFEAWMCQFNVEAGEDIRYLDRDQATELGLPNCDYWLFDDDRLAVLHFDDGDKPLGAEIITDIDQVEQHRTWLETAVANSTDFAAFAEGRVPPIPADWKH